MIQLIASIFGAIKEFFGFQNKKLELKNTEEMKRGEKLSLEQKQQDQINNSIANKDADEIRKMLS